MRTRADLVLRAQQIAAPLIDAERIALGVALIGTAQRADSWGMKLHAARLVNAQAAACLNSEFHTSRTPVVDGRTGPEATTHEQSAPSHPMPRGSSLRAAWDRFSGSLWGDVLGLVCVLVFVAGVVVGLPLIAGGVQ